MDKEIELTNETYNLLSELIIEVESFNEVILFLIKYYNENKEFFDENRVF